MKIVHSYWSKPAQSIISGLNEKSHGGWRHKKYQYMSWALSCLSFKKYYGEIELVTDKAGKNILIDELQLPYTSVKVELDKLNDYPEKLWAIGKLYAYGLQEKPFIHIDNDVFIWERFPKRIESATLIAQHVDFDEKHYHFALQHLKDNQIKIPLVLINDFNRYKKFSASNAGIIGGTNMEFFKRFVKQAFKFIDATIEVIDENLIGASYAIIYEQYLFSSMARNENLRIEHFFENPKSDDIDLSSFLNKYGDRKYVHLISETKSYAESCRELEQQLILEYPQFHRKITSLF